MLSISAINAKPGMVLAAPLHHPDDPEIVLLQPGVELDEKLINRLVEMHAGELWIRYPGLEYIAEHYCPEVGRAQRQLTQLFSSQLDAIGRGSAHGLIFDKLQSAVGSLLSAFQKKPKSAVFVKDVAQRDQEALRHGSSVCMLSLLLGIQLEHYIVAQRRRILGFTGKDISCLGIGAMLHDIGMLRLEKDVRERWSSRHDRHDPEWQRHVMIGYEMVKGHLSPSASGVVLHHHQRYDGSGFPHRADIDGDTKPVVGKDIHIFARICAVADAFDRLRIPTTSHVPALPNIAAQRIMIERALAGEFDPIVVHGLVRIAPAFAPGTVVHLNTGQDAVVTEWNQDDPCRPVVLPIETHRSILAKQHDADFEPDPVDLSMDHSIYISRVDDHRVAGFLFDPDLVHALLRPRGNDDNDADRYIQHANDQSRARAVAKELEQYEQHNVTHAAPDHQQARRSATRLTRHPPAA
ncbi:MAG: HD domain-containing protein [Phycisphaeraceae bacterium]|nr:HD domain-containing protein [Phycisphaerales bacterium]MCB9859463.1 HD domain-containing protein [Phycisphaeraceae bacterium]